MFKPKELQRLLLKFTLYNFGVAKYGKIEKINVLSQTQ